MRIARFPYLLIAFCIATLVAGCSTSPKKTASVKPGGYYQDDGPGIDPPPDLDATPDAIPRIEPLATGANQPYVIFGKRYVPQTAEKPFRQEGLASWYGKKFHGNSTSNGETYDMYAMTAAHPTLPIPSYARVTSKVNGRSVIVRVNDRGPFHGKRIIDLSYTAAHRLGLVARGSGPVVVERITPEEIRAMASQTQAAAANDPGPASLQAMAMPAVQEGGAEAPAAVTATAPAASAGSMAADAGTKVYLQMGAFSQQANAQELASQVNARLNGADGLPPAVIERGDRLYRVKIGPYASRESAMGAVQAVSDRTGILPSLTTR
ncbi:septal ring lytic transglycosylase RlpA family protein [Bordetella sp. 2513F-2]